MSSKVISTLPRAGFPQSSFKYTPLEHVRTIYVLFAQGLFHAMPRGFYHWEPNIENSDIVITDENPIHLEQIGTRPAISFTRGQVQFYTLGIDDMLSYEFETGKKIRSVLVPGTMHVNCCSRVDIEADNIAWYIAEMLWLHREMLMKAGFFEIGRQPTIGTPSKAGEIVAGDSADEWYCTTVSTPFQFYRTSQTTPINSDITKSIQMSLRSHMLPAEGQKGIPTPSHEVPASVEGAPPSPFFGASDVYGDSPNPAGIGLSKPQLIPHPLNPAVQVQVRSSRSFGPAMRPPSIRGRTIPILPDDVEGSELPVDITSLHKV